MNKNSITKNMSVSNQKVKNITILNYLCYECKRINYEYGRYKTRTTRLYKSRR
ncbi:hypothetical protein GCM10007384_30880 [Aquimarina muelleri]|uniref:Uncharacterized protein n=1 Tax=Aquimarina muelleri TaxID=279356 RepID=A0A918N451_9FLAO|nr:hypothetical protein GCM10007384_30880 [Aquimarina muelleri]